MGSMFFMDALDKKKDRGENPLSLSFFNTDTILTNINSNAILWREISPTQLNVKRKRMFNKNFKVCR